MRAVVAGAASVGAVETCCSPAAREAAALAIGGPKAFVALSSTGSRPLQAVIARMSVKLMNGARITPHQQPAH
jgi:hypothetical protein